MKDKTNNWEKELDKQFNFEFIFGKNSLALSNFKQFIKDLRKKVLDLIIKEIAEANTNGEDTSRLTRIYNLINL